MSLLQIRSRSPVSRRDVKVQESVGRVCNDVVERKSDCQFVRGVTSWPRNVAKIKDELLY
jgi:hypothetical protein